MKAWSLFAVLLIFLSAHITFAQEFNAGFVQGLWYSQEEIFAGDSIRIYIAIRNNTGSDLTGTVEFFDGDVRIDRKTVQALDGRIIESWADWKATYGSHTLSANLARIELHKVGSSTQVIEATSALAEDTLFVDYDTDNDDIGNEDDRDDDGDAISDEQEKSDGTNPLVKNIVEMTEEEESEIERADNEEVANDKVEEETAAHDSDRDGLEQFLAESPAENVFSTVTNYINNAKQNLDTYREERSLKKQGEQTSAASSTINVDGFGEIVRGQSGPEEIPTLKIEGEGFFDKFFSLAGSIVSAVYTGILATLSFILAHPMFVQLGILILILIIIVKLASKFGRRPKRY